MLKFSASLAASAANVEVSRFTSHTTSGPSTPPIGGTRSAASAEKCAIMAHVRSSAEVEGGTLVFTALPLRESALACGQDNRLRARSHVPLSRIPDRCSHEL